MTIPDIGILCAADEQMNHQIADTFSTVAVSDRGWTEKVWASLAREDGGLQIDFGLGKYINRNVVDAFAGISRGAEQWTVRSSRKLADAPEQTGAGPIDYEIIEPLRAVRFVLRANDTQPIAFDVTFHAVLPPFFEKRNRARADYRVAIDVVRYHQAGRITGWIEINGQREQLADDWFGFRDHSWGMRGDYIGAPPTDIPEGIAINRQMGLFWGPWVLTAEDGQIYEIQHFLLNTANYDYHSGYINHPDGRQEEIRRIIPHVKFDTSNRYFLGGRFELHMMDGQIRHVEVEPVGESGFHMRTGEYGGWKGGRHGSWRGDYHEDGEYIADCRVAVPQLGQFRDRPVRVREGTATGFGIQETIIVGDWPQYHLDAASDFSADF